MKDKYRVAIISDTHGLLREEVLDIIKKCDYIIHGGDIHKKEIRDRLEEIAPLFVVRGNNDKGIWAEQLPKELYFNIGNLNFYMVHNQNDLPNNLRNIDIVVFGHSHKYFYEKVENITFINPGSCGPKRFNLPINFVIMTIENNNYKIEKIEI